MINYSLFQEEKHLKIKKAKFFPYGVRIKGTKELTREKPIVDMPQSKTLYISLSQHIGAPSTPVVEVGDTVKRGTLIGKATGLISANIFSPVSGVVKEIKPIVDALNRKQTYVVIENDFKNEIESLPTMEDFSASAIIERIRLAGMVGLGGAGFPTAVKLTPSTPVDTLIINGAECEPYLTCDYRLMVEKSQEIYKGIRYLALAIGVKRIIIGIEVNKPEAIEIFSKFSDIETVKLKKRYPMGSEKHLIYCTTGRKVPPAKLPADVGCVVQNVKTALDCYYAIEKDEPLTHIVMTVSGKGVQNPQNIRVAIGTPISEIIEFCGGVKDAKKIIAGGPMMGKALNSLEQFVRKTDSGLLVLTEKETDLALPTPCINCANCAKNCPMHLMPMYIEKFANAGDFKSAEKYGAMNCIECGTCAYNCPANRPLVQSINYAKGKIKEMKNNAR